MIVFLLLPSSSTQSITHFAHMLSQISSALMRKIKRNTLQDCYVLASKIDKHTSYCNNRTKRCARTSLTFSLKRKSSPAYRLTFRLAKSQYLVRIKPHNRNKQTLFLYIKHLFV
uniref:(northern house mosquito) hypothetical protein n=1 Tax=Culex pipiens TaxID=7175 RepID=A0A8D8FH48_CULPI